MPLDIRARLSDGRIAVAADESQRLLYLELSAPVAGGATLPLNLGLALDKSGSMQGEALDCVKAAARHIVRNLSERDRVAVVAFNDEPEVLVASRQVSDAGVVEALIARLQAGGGTCIDGAMDFAVRELRKANAPALLGDYHGAPAALCVNRIFVLTDGHNRNGDDGRCVDIAHQAVREHISFSTFGIGEQFDVGVLREVADAGNGMLHHLPTPAHIDEAFRKELQAMQRIGATHVRLRLRLADGVELGDKDPVYLVSPAIVSQEVVRETGAMSVSLGDMPADGPIGLLVTLYLRSAAPGRHPVATIEATFKDVAGPGRHGPLDVDAEWLELYTAEVDPDVQKAIARLAIYKQRQKAIAAAASNPDLARTMLQSATALADEAGNEELKTLLQATLAELQRDGRISDRTLIEGEVAARTVLQ